MSFYTLWGSLEIGLVFSLVALGVFITFRVLNFPDLTVDGSFPLGAATAAVLQSDHARNITPVSVYRQPDFDGTED